MQATTTSALKWCAGFALILGCGSNADTTPTSASVSADLEHRHPGRGFDLDHGQPPRPHHPPFHGYFGGHPHPPGHGNGNGGAGPGAGGSVASSSGGTTSSAGQGTGNGRGGNFGAAGAEVSSGGFAGTSFSSGGFAGFGVPSVCGDGVTQYLESCDDGNTTDGDGCSATCEVEVGYTCPWNEPCRPVVCGDGNEDGYLNADGFYVYEQCDDGNTTNGDGCSATCAPEVGYYCSYPGQACKKVVCGDGSVDLYVSGIFTGSGGAAGSGAGSAGFTGSGMAGAGFNGSGGAGVSGPYIAYGYEQCDDGNSASGDGCSATCQIEPLYVCPTPGSPCHVPRCGDGYVDYIAGGDAGSGSGGMTGIGGSGAYGVIEACDDGNVTSGDGCSATCSVEAGYSCPEPGVACKLAVCGDSILDWPAEGCDDGNQVPGDGCNEHCQSEYGSGGFGGSAGSSFGVGAGSGPVMFAGAAGFVVGAGGAR